MDDVKQELIVIRERLYDLNATLARNTEILEAHHKRTTLNEQRIEFIEKHVMLVNAVFKIVMTFGAVLVALDQLDLFSISSLFNIK